MTNEETDEQRAQRYLESALKNDYITGLAAAKWANPGDYGRISESWAADLLAKAPNQEAWDRVYADKRADGSYGPNSILNEDAPGFHQGSIKARCLGIVQGTLAALSVDKVLELMGVKKPVADGYKGKPVAKLSEEERQALISGYMTDLANQHAIKTLNGQRKAISGGLEKKFCKKDAPKPSS